MWNNTIKLFLISLLCFLILQAVPVCANTSDSLKKEVQSLPVDSTQRKALQPDAAKEHHILDADTYRYDRIGPAPKTWWDRFKEWFWRTIDEIFSSKEGNIGVTIFEYLLIVVVIVVVILLVLKHEVRTIFSGKGATVKLQMQELEEDLHGLDFDQAIQEALKRNDRRKAVRLHFLKLLKELSDKGEIRWEINKTNRDYQLELTNNKKSRFFNELVKMYEYVWYGDFQPDENVYVQVVEKFNSFRN